MVVMDSARRWGISVSGMPRRAITTSAFSDGGVVQPGANASTASNASPPSQPENVPAVRDMIPCRTRCDQIYQPMS